MDNIQTKPDKLINKLIHKNAEELLKKYINDYSISLIYQSKLEAFNDEADEVQSNHVKKAINIIGNNKNKYWRHEFFKIVGGTLFGLFITGYISSLTPPNPLQIVIYTIIGFIGILLVFIGIS